MQVTINKTIGIGDAGTAFNLSLNVEYEQDGNVITVIDSNENETPYDNPPEKWYKRMEQIIEDHFFEQDKDSKVIFK